MTLDYISLCMAAMLLAVNFAINKIYQQKEGTSFLEGLKFNVILGLFTAVVFFVINGFKFEISSYSIVMATAMTILCTLYTIIGFRVLEKGNVALYSISLMTGGMIVPYIWGVVLLNEQLFMIRILGLIIIVFSVIVINTGLDKTNFKQGFMCGAIFLLNGFVSVVSKLHQINPMAISSIGFVVLTGLLKFIICLPILCFFKKKKQYSTVKRKTESTIAIYGIILLSALVNGISFLLQLIGAKNIDASVLYPLITGGSIFFSALVGRLYFKEKLTKRLTVGVVLCLIGTCMFL